MAVLRKPHHKPSANNSRRRNRNKKSKKQKVHRHNAYQKQRVNNEDVRPPVITDAARAPPTITAVPQKQKHHNKPKKQKPQQKIIEDVWPPIITDAPGGDSLEKIVNTTRPVQRDYAFVRAGNVYITRMVKRLCKEEKMCIYTVIIGGGKIGLQVPVSVYITAVDLDKSTEATRKKAVDSKDTRERKEAMKCLTWLFTHIPEKDADRVVNYAFKKRTGRVGRTGTLALEERLRMATIAHIRHTHTDYDERLKAAGHGLSQEQRKRNRRQARNAVTMKIQQVWTSWGPPKKTPWTRLDCGYIRGKAFTENGYKIDDGPKDQLDKNADAPPKKAPRSRRAISNDSDSEDSTTSIEDFIEDTSDEEDAISDDSDYDPYDEDYPPAIEDDSDLEIIELVMRHDISEPPPVPERNTNRSSGRLTRSAARKPGIEPDIEIIEISD